MNLSELKEKFEDALETLQHNNRYLAIEVTKLGYPTLSTQVPTAGVGWDENNKKIIFMFNPKFAEFVSDEEFAFTICHEAMHLLNAHIFLIRDELEKMKKHNKTNQEMLKFRQKINIAADCVVNDTLVNLYNLQKCFSKKTDTIKAFYGKPTVGVDCHDLTAMDVYYLIPENPQEQNQNGQGGGSGEVENHEEWESFFNSDGTVNKDFVDALKDFIDENIENSSLSDREAEELEKFKEKMENSSDSYTSRAGKQAIGNKRPIDGLGKETLNWNKILYQFVETLKTEDVWTKPNRKLQSVYPDVVLPSWRDQEKEKLFVAIDTSGSIDYKALRLFLTVIKNTPKRFQIDAITFDTQCYPYDINKDKEPRGGGGTCFKIIEKYIQDNFKKYPKAIFVLTDGWGTAVQPQYPNRWAWILYGHASTAYCQNMKQFNIKDLLQ